MGILAIREDCWIWLELPMITKHDLPMRRLPGDVRAFGSMRLCLREAWKDMTNKRSDGQLKPLPRNCHFGSGSGSGPAAVRSGLLPLRQR